MSDDKKNMLSTNSGLTTGGLGAVLTTLVPLVAPEQNRTVSGVLSYTLSRL